MTINSADERQRISLLTKYRGKTLSQLETERRGLERSTEDSQREIGLLEAMINGLVDRKPYGFGARVEELRKQQSNLQTALSSVDLIRQVISEVITEKENEL